MKLALLKDWEREAVGGGVPAKSWDEQTNLSRDLLRILKSRISDKTHTHVAAAAASVTRLADF